MAALDDALYRRLAATLQRWCRGGPTEGGWASNWMPIDASGTGRWNHSATEADWFDFASGRRGDYANFAIELCGPPLPRPPRTEGKGRPAPPPSPRTLILHDIDAPEGGWVDPVVVRTGMLYAFARRLIVDTPDPDALAVDWPALTPAHVPGWTWWVSAGGWSVHVQAHAAMLLAYACAEHAAERMDWLAKAADLLVGGGWGHDMLMKKKTYPHIRVLGSAKHAPTHPLSEEPRGQGPNAGAVLDWAGNCVRGEAMLAVLETAMAAAPLAILSLRDCWLTVHAALYSHKFLPDPTPIKAGMQNRSAMTLVGSLLAGYGLAPTPENARWAAEQVLDLFVFADDATATTAQTTKWHTEVHSTAQSQARSMADGNRPGGCDRVRPNPRCRLTTVGKQCSEPTDDAADADAGVGRGDDDAARAHVRLVPRRVVAVPTPAPAPAAEAEAAPILADMEPVVDETPAPDATDGAPPPPSSPSAPSLATPTDGVGLMRRVRATKTTPEFFTSKADPLRLADDRSYGLVRLQDARASRATIRLTGAVLTINGVDYRIEVDHCQRPPRYRFTRDGWHPVEITIDALCGDRRSERRRWAVALGLPYAEIWSLLPESALSLLQAAIQRVARPIRRIEHEVMADAVYELVWSAAPERTEEAAEQRAAIGRAGVPLGRVLATYRTLMQGAEKLTLRRARELLDTWPTGADGIPFCGVSRRGPLLVCAGPIDDDVMQGAAERDAAATQTHRAHADGAVPPPPTETSTETSTSTSTAEADAEADAEIETLVRAPNAPTFTKTEDY